MMIADRLKMSVARAKRETSSSGYLRWLFFIEEDQKARKTQEYGMAMIAFEIHLLRAMQWSGKDKNGNDVEFPFRKFEDFFFPPLEEKVEEKKEEPITEEEYNRQLEMSKAIWAARLGGKRKPKEKLRPSPKKKGTK